MAGASLEHVLAAGAADPAGRAEDHRRALVVRLVIAHEWPALGLELLPGALERRRLPLGIMAIDELALPGDPRGDELIRELAKHRAAFLVVGVEQRLAAPALQPRRNLPAEIGHVLEPIVEPEAAIRRMRMGGVA